MSKKHIFATAIITILLFGCDRQPHMGVNIYPSGGQVSINPLPVIISVVADEVSELDLNHRDTVFSRVCRVAYGEVKPSAFREEFNRSREADKEKLSAFSRLLQSDDITPYQTVCAAYMIKSATSIPDVNKYVTYQKNADGQTVIKSNEEAIVNLMPFRLAVVRATAELFAHIAEELPEKKAMSGEMYNQKIHRLFVQSASDYLETVRKYNKEEINNKYQLLLLQEGRFVFKSSTGYMIDITTERLSLYLYGTPWLANGYILGLIHNIDITIW